MENIVKEVEAYFANECLPYEVLQVLRASNHPSDSYLYHVIAKKVKCNEFAIWTCYNSKTKCLNFGHYGIMSIEEALRIHDEYFIDVRKGSI